MLYIIFEQILISIFLSLMILLLNRMLRAFKTQYSVYKEYFTDTASQFCSIACSNFISFTILSIYKHLNHKSNVTCDKRTLVLQRFVIIKRFNLILSHHSFKLMLKQNVI